MYLHLFHRYPKTIAHFHFFAIIWYMTMSFVFNSLFFSVFLQVPNSLTIASFLSDLAGPWVLFCYIKHTLVSPYCMHALSITIIIITIIITIIIIIIIIIIVIIFIIIRLYSLVLNPRNKPYVCLYLLQTPVVNAITKR